MSSAITCINMVRTQLNCMFTSWEPLLLNQLILFCKKLFLQNNISHNAITWYCTVANVHMHRQPSVTAQLQTGGVVKLYPLSFSPEKYFHYQYSETINVI